MGEYLWHRTSPDNVDSILREGLLRRHSNHWRGAGGCIYLSTTPDTGFGEALLRVDAAGLTVADLSGWEYVCWDDIPPERITEVRRDA